jgi:hypothetical protein
LKGHGMIVMHCAVGEQWALSPRDPQGLHMLSRASGTSVNV